MTKEIVKYHNQMNEVSFGIFKEKELDLFFSICYKLKEQGTKEIELSFSELKNLIGETDHLQRLKLHISNLNKKLASINYEIEIAPRVFERFVLFTNFTTDYNKCTLTIKTNEKFSYILNNLINKYTKFDLLDFISLKSIYSKNMFKLFKQWESLGEIQYSLDEIKEKLNIPTAYSTSDFNKRVLMPIMEELPQYFPNLKLEKIKTGKKVTSLKFTWDKRKDIIEIVEEKTNQITISQNLYDLTKEIQSLNFFKNVMTPRNIEKLTKKYDEKTLTQILKRAKDHTYQEIKSIKYFDSIYESIKTEPIIIIKPSEKIIEKEVSTVEKREEIKKIDITREEFNKKYEEYLKQFNFSDDTYMKTSFGIKYNIMELEEKSTQEIKVFTEKDIPENELLGKNGKKLTGAALQMRINKILIDWNDLYIKKD